MMFSVYTSFDERVDRRSDVRRSISHPRIIISISSISSNGAAVPALVLELVLTLDQAEPGAEPYTRHGERVAPADVQLL